MAPRPSILAWSRLHAHDVTLTLTKHQFRCIFDRDDALLVGDEARQHIQHRRFAGTGATRNDDVEPRPDRGLEEVEHRLRQRTAFDEILRAKSPRCGTGGSKRQVHRGR